MTEKVGLFARADHMGTEGIRLFAEDGSQLNTPAARATHQIASIFAAYPPPFDARLQTVRIIEMAIEATINTPEIEQFLAAVSLEAGHQVERWGTKDRQGKAPADWFWLLGYLAGKALAASNAGDVAKHKHHIISSAAVLLNWHRFAAGSYPSMRPGIATPAGEAPVADDESGAA